MHGVGHTDMLLSGQEISRTVRTALSEEDLDGKRVLVIIPDATRSAPIPEMFRLLHGELGDRVAALDFLIALGTHQPLSEERIDALIGVNSHERRTVSGVNVFNHEWFDPETFVSLGTISSEEVSEISGGMLSEEVDVRINRKVVEYDHVIVCGPVFPHEVVGFSGGNKYFFPGVSGPEVIDLSHWLGALITNYEIIGRTGVTPVRRLIDRAASLIPTPRLCLAMVVEPAVEDGGEVVIYAPHITEFSRTHGESLAEIGYHVRDYFTKQWEKYKDYPGTVLAHSTHLKGAGSYDEENGEEKPRVRVTLATGISERSCEEHTLGYLDPDEVDPEEWSWREDESLLVVPKAGETLYRIRDDGGSEATRIYADDGDSRER